MQEGLSAKGPCLLKAVAGEAFSCPEVIFVPRECTQAVEHSATKQLLNAGLLFHSLSYILLPPARHMKGDIANLCAGIFRLNCCFRWKQL